MLEGTALRVGLLRNSASFGRCLRRGRPFNVGREELTRVRVLVEASWSRGPHAVSPSSLKSFCHGQGLEAVVEKLAALGPGILEQRDGSWRTPTQVAEKYGHMRIQQILREAGALAK
jgi:hypothetical protein